MIERICLPTKEQVAAFLPPIVPGRMLDPKNPRSIGTFGAQDVYTEVKRAQEAALLASEKVFAELQGDFAKAFGRSYRAVEPFHTDDAEVVVLTMGAAGETARTAVEELRADGHKVGHVGLRLWRPFPAAELQGGPQGRQGGGRADRALNPGGQGAPWPWSSRPPTSASRRPPRCATSWPAWAAASSRAGSSRNWSARPRPRRPPTSASPSWT